MEYKGWKAGRRELREEERKRERKKERRKAVFTEYRSHDADAGVFAGSIWSSDTEFGEGREAGGGELCAAAFGGHGYDGEAFFARSVGGFGDVIVDASSLREGVAFRSLAGLVVDEILANRHRHVCQAASGS